MKISAVGLLIGALLLPTAACQNPASGKSKAKTGAPKSVDKVPGNGAAEHITLSEANTKVEFTGSKVTGKHDGGFKKLSGTILVAEGKPEKSRISLSIDMNSTWSDTAKLTGHLKSKDFFYVSKFPETKFVSTSITKGGEKGANYTITGNLTLRGVTKSISFPAHISVTPDSFSAQAEFWINRYDWQIEYKGMADNLIRKEVVIRLKLQGKRHKG